MFWNKKEDKDKLPDLPPFKQSVIPSPIEENEMKEIVEKIKQNIK